MVKFLMSVLNWPINFWSNFTSFFTVMTHKSPVNFELIHFLLWIKGPNKSPNFSTFKRALVKICQIPHVIFESTNYFSFKLCINIQCRQKGLLCAFLAQKCYTLVKRSSLKCKFLMFLNALMKICQNYHFIFQIARKVFFEFYITLQCHER